MSNWQEQEDDEPQQQQQRQQQQVTTAAVAGVVLAWGSSAGDSDVDVGSVAPQIKLNELKES